MRLIRPLAAASLMLAVGCTTAKMHVPTSLATRSSELPLAAFTGDAMDTRLAFGAYEVHTIDQAPVSTWTENNIVSLRHEYSYFLTDTKSNEWKVECSSLRTANGQGPQYDRDSSSVKLDCTIQNVFAETPKKWRLRLAGTDGGGGLRSGEIRGKKTRLRIQSCHDDQDARALGFDIIYKDQPIAAVQTADDGRVWLHGDLGGALKAVVATSAAGLFLFDTLTNT